MTLRFDMSTTVRLCLALLLLAAVVGPACLLTSPALAMANTMPSGDCSSPARPSGDLNCPHSSGAQTIQAAKEISHDLVATPATPAVLPEVVPQESVAPVPVVSSTAPVAHLTPLRL